MAWATPRTWTVGEQDTAAKMNQDIRDNGLYLYSPPKVLVYNSAAQSIADNTLTAVTFNTEAHDTDTIHSATSNTSRLTIVTAGYYHVKGQVSWAASTASYRMAQIRYNGSTILGQALAHPVQAAGVATIHELSKDLFLNAGDYVELMVKHQVGSAINVNGGAAETFFQAHWIGGA